MKTKPNPFAKMDKSKKGEKPMDKMHKGMDMSGMAGKKPMPFKAGGKAKKGC